VLKVHSGDFKICAYKPSGWISGKEALAAVQGMVKETTSTLIEENMEKVKSETKEMISQVEKTVTTLQKAMESEQAKREKADEQINVLRQKVVSLTNSLDQKADASTVEQISKTVGMIQSTISIHKERTLSSEKEMTMIKQAMVTLFRRTQTKEKEVKHCKEVHEVHHVHHVHKVESTERITAVSKRVTQVEAAASAQISKLSSYITKVKAKLEADEAARLKSDASLRILQEQTMSLFEKVAANSDKVSALDAKITERIESLTSMLNEISIKMQVSEQSSKQDLSRMDKMLQSLVTELAAEESARMQGDTKMESAIMSRVQLLIEELVEVQNKNAALRISSKMECVCNTVTEMGVSKTKCTKDGKEVSPKNCNCATCGKDWKPSIASDGSSSSKGKAIDISGESSSSSSSSSKTQCKCEASFADGKFTEVCTQDGKEVPKSECPSIEGAPSLDDLLNKAKANGGTTSSSSSSTKTVGTGSSTSSTKSSSSSSSKCQCQSTFENGEFKEVCTKSGKEVPKSECPNMKAMGNADLEELMKGSGPQGSSPDSESWEDFVKKHPEAGENENEPSSLEDFEKLTKGCHCDTSPDGEKVCIQDGEIVPDCDGSES
jgi:hypothetical protein